MSQSYLADRRRFIAGAGAALAAPRLVRAQTAPEFVTVGTASGRLRGRRVAGVDVFKGVPYGDTVSGAARFRPARAAPSWA
ncbi:MAG: carboxylesterase family protein, partial [Caulobacteraceae bacterium]